MQLYKLETTLQTHNDKKVQMQINTSSLQLQNRGMPNLIFVPKP